MNKCREDFEKWAKSEGLYLTQDKYGYVLPNTAAAWEAWCHLSCDAHSAPQVAPVPWPKRDDITEDMRAGFERLYREKAERDGRTLERNEQGAYAHLPVDADWIFYQRAWADALEAVAPDEREIAALREDAERYHFLISIFGADDDDLYNAIDGAMPAEVRNDKRQPTKAEMDIALDAARLRAGKESN